MKNNNSSTLLPCILALLASLTLSGCAGKPWTTALEGERLTETNRIVDSLSLDNQSCGKSLEGDLDLFYSDPLGKKALSGYLRFSVPGSYKFVVANPFGQTVMALAGDQKSYQAVAVPDQMFYSGSLRSFGIRHKVPMEILNGPWGEWLTGRSQRPSSMIASIHEDKQARGVWISFRHEKSEPAGMSHLLLDTSNKLPLARMLEDSSGKIVAEITYGNWNNQGECRQPQDINITGLDYGVDIRLKLSNIQLSSEVKQFTLPVPPGYTQQRMP